MTKSVSRPLLGALACACALAMLATLVYGYRSVQVLDTRLLAAFVVPSGSAIATIATAIAYLGDFPALLAMLALACGIALGRGRPRDAVAAFAIVAGANLTTQLLKLAFAHPRLRAVLGADHFAWDGFPSGHVTAAASIAIAYAFVVPPRLRPAVVLVGTGLAAAMGCAVVMLNWHYPSDVLGGILVAATWGFAVLAGRRLLEEGWRPTRQPARRPAISLK